MSRSLHGNGVKKNKYECFLIKYSTVLVCTVCLRIQQRINCQNTLKQSKSMYFMKPLLHENGFFRPARVWSSYPDCRVIESRVFGTILYFKKWS